MAADQIPPAPSSAWLWPVGLFTLMCASVAVCVGTAIIASGDPSFGLEPDYYDKAVAWDHTAAAREASERLGWVAGAEISNPSWPTAERTLTVRATDRLGSPIAAEAIEVVTFHHARSREHVELSIGTGAPVPAVGVGAVVAAEPGCWVWSVGEARAGVWQVRIRISRGNATFVAVLDVETPDGGR